MQRLLKAYAFEHISGCSILAWLSLFNKNFGENRKFKHEEFKFLIFVASDNGRQTRKIFFITQRQGTFLIFCPSFINEEKIMENF